MSLYLVRHFILFLYLLILNGCFSLIAQTKDEMVLIPEGVFTMGYNIKNKNEWGDTDEGPVHKVFLKPYYIDRYEVSASQFSKFLNHHQKKTHLHQKKTRLYFQTGLGVTIEKIGSLFCPRPGLSNYPANRVAWYDADAYCRWVNKRLPRKRSGEKPLEEPMVEFSHGAMSSQPITGLPSAENLIGLGLKL